MDYLEFIARVTSHIPDKGQVMIRYGLYSNAHRGKMLKDGVSPSHPLIIEDEGSGPCVKRAHLGPYLIRPGECCHLLDRPPCRLTNLPIRVLRRVYEFFA